MATNGKVAVPSIERWSSFKTGMEAASDRCGRRPAARGLSSVIRLLSLGAAFAMLSRPFMQRSLSRLTSRITRSGFTLPEILIVIVLISVLALVAIPRFASANGKRHLESARMRVAAGLATARAAAIQKGETVRFKIASNRVTVRRVAGSTDLISPVPLDTLYKVTVGSDVTIDYGSRGFATSGAGTTIWLSRSGLPNDSLVVTTTGMVQR